VAVREPDKPGRPTPEVRAAAQRLRIDYTTAEVLRAFDAAAVKSILLKGASIVRWLYDDAPTRAYIDCDLLVRPADAEAGTHVLTGLGFVPEIEEAEMPEWWREHGVQWTRAADGAAVDLHRTLVGVEVDADQLWETLLARTETMLVGGFPARVLTTPGRALHVALHTAQHGWEQHGFELERALQRADEATWRDAARLAESLGATGAFATGLRVVPAGRELAERLGLPGERSIDVALRAGEAPAQALTFERLARARGLRARFSILRHKLVPPPTFMRKWSPRARRGRVGLAVAYVQRPVWVLRRARPALRAWREARRAARSEASRRG
jgi:hypothetical protein